MSPLNRKGSLQVAQAIGSSIMTLLGPSTSLKCCIDDDGDEIICSDAFKILQHINVKHPAWFIIHDSCQAMNKTCGCGCKTLLCMLGFWSREAMDLLWQGIPIPVLTQLFSEALDECIDLLDDIKIPLQDINDYWIYDQGFNEKQKYDVTPTEYSKQLDVPSQSDEGKDSLTATSQNTQTCVLEEATNKPQEKEKDEFDDCFDHFSGTETNSSYPLKVNLQSSSCSNKNVLKRTNEMLKKIASLKLSSKSLDPTSSSRLVIFSSRNLVPDTPKTEAINTSNGVNGCHFNETSKHGKSNIFKVENIKLLGDVLSHGKQIEMKLAIEVICAHMSEESYFKVDKNCIYVETMFGPKHEYSQVINGILLETTSEFIPKNNVNVVLVNGDITHDYRHAGHKESFQSKQVFTASNLASSSPSKFTWLEKAKKIITQENIQAIICKGTIDKDLEEFCISVGVTTICKVLPKVLKLLATCLETSIVIYLTDFKKSDVGKPITINNWIVPGQRAIEHKKYVVLNMKDGHRRMKTVLLCSQTKHLLYNTEVTFWKCISKLKNTLNQKCVLPGAGRTELECVQRLSLIADKCEDPIQTRSSNWIKRSLSSYRKAVYLAMANGFLSFTTALALNAGHGMQDIPELVHTNNKKDFKRLSSSVDNNKRPIGDDYLAKVQSWKSAISIINVLLQSDMIVETGLNS